MESDLSRKESVRGVPVELVTVAQSELRRHTGRAPRWSKVHYRELCSDSVNAPIRTAPTLAPMIPDAIVKILKYAQAAT